jgi:hypothetical protein
MTVLEEIKQLKRQLKIAEEERKMLQRTSRKTVSEV